MLFVNIQICPALLQPLTLVVFTQDDYKVGSVSSSICVAILRPR